MRLTDSNSSVVSKPRAMEPINVFADVVYRCSSVIRAKNMSLWALIEDPNTGNVVDVEIKEYPVEVYCLRVERIKNGVKLSEGDFVVGTKFAHVEQAWEIVKINEPMFTDIEVLLENHGMPDPKEIDERAAAAVRRYAREKHIVPSNVLRTSTTTLIHRSRIRD